MSNKTMLGDASGRGAVDGFRVTCPAMQHPYTEAEIDAVVKVMREACGQTQGKYMVEFEQAFCAFTGAKHAFAVNNCTSALKMAPSAIWARRSSGPTSTRIPGPSTRTISPARSRPKRRLWSACTCSVCRAT